MGCGASHPDDGGRPESTKHTMKEAPELIDDFDTRANGSLSKSSMRLGQLSKSRLDTHVQREMLQLPDEKALGTMRKRSRALSVAPRARRMSSIINTFESSIMGLLGSDGDDDFDDADDTERLRSLFDLIAATNASGDNDTITLSALTGGFRRMGWQKKSAEVTKIFQFADTDNSGKIEWPEFQNFFKHIVSDIKPCGDDYTGLEQLVNDRKTGKDMPQKSRIGSKQIRSYKIKYLPGFSSRVTALALAPNRPILACVDKESSNIQVHNIATGKLALTMNSHQENIVCIALSPDNKFAATSSKDALLLIWDMTVGCVSKEIEHPGVITCCAFSPDGKFLITGCQDSICRKYQTAKGKLVRMTDRLPSMDKGVVVSIAYQAVDGNTFAITRSHESFVRVMSAISFLQLHTLKGHSTMVWNIEYSFNGSRLLSHCDRFVKLWDPLYKECYGTYDIAHYVEGEFDKVRNFWTAATMLFPPYEYLIAAITSNHVVHFLDIHGTSSILQIQFKSPIFCIASQRSESIMAAGDDNGNLFLIELE